MTISHGERAGTHDTQGDSFIAPGSAAPLSSDPEDQVARLREFLASMYPQELHRTNVQYPEAVADVAIRVMLTLGTSVHPAEQRRCSRQQGPCNKPAEHRDNCGIVVGRRG